MDDVYARPAEYFENVRDDIVPYVTKPAERALEVGCGAGMTLRHLKEIGLAKTIAGIEQNAEAAKAAEQRLDALWTGDAADILARPDGPERLAPFDLILCLDVLEHLIDPWSVTRRLADLLAPGGTLVASLPNVRFYRVAAALLFKGEWQYEETGVLDSTHLRFFTRKTIHELFAEAGLDITRIDPVGKMKPWRNKWIFNKLSGGRLVDIYSYAYLLSAAKPGA